MRRKSASNWDSALNAARIEQFKQIASERPTSAAEIYAALGLSRQAGAKLLTHLRPQCHVAGWLGYAPLYSWGAKPDMPRPDRLVRGEPVLAGDDVADEARADRLRNANRFKPQPVHRDWSVAVVVGGAHA